MQEAKEDKKKPRGTAASLACAVPIPAIADDSLERDPTSAWGPCLKCLQQQDQRAQNWDNWVCVPGWLEQGVWRTGRRRTGGRSICEKRSFFFVVSGSEAQQEGLCSTLTRGWPVDRGWRWRWRWSEERRMSYSQAGRPKRRKAPVS